MNLESFLSNTKNIFKKSLIYSVIPLMIFSGCKKDEYDYEKTTPTKTETENPTKNSALYDNVKVLDNTNAITSYNSPYVNFSSAVSFQAGDIISGGITSATPDGLLRKVISISEDGKSVTTSQAKYDEAIKTGTIIFESSLTQPGIESLVCAPSVSPKLQKSTSYNFGYDINNKVIFDKDNNPFTTYDQITADGGFDCNVSPKLKLYISEGKIDSMYFGLDFTGKSDLKLTYKSDSLKFDNEVELWHAKFNPILVPGTPIPIIIRLNLSIYINAEGLLNSKIIAGATEDISVQGGLIYKNGSWISEQNFSNNFNFQQPTIDFDAQFKAGLGAKLILMTNGILGPSVGILGYLNLNANSKENPWWKLNGGLEGLIGIDMGIISKIIPPIEKQIVDYTKLLAQAEGGFVSPIDSLPKIKTLTLQPGPVTGKDVYTRVSNFSGGTTTYSGFGNDTILETWYESGKTLEEIFIQFSKSQIPSNANISSAKLMLYGIGLTNYDYNPTINVAEVTSSWDESIKGDNKPSYGNSIASLVVPWKNDWNEWDVTSSVQKWINGNSNYGFAVFTNTNDGAGVFRSSDCKEGSKRPKLIINYFEK